MDIEIVDGLPTKLMGNEAVVLIDVFRASSSIVSLVVAGISEILISETHDRIRGYVDSNTEVLSEIHNELNTKDNSPVAAFVLNPELVSRAIVISQNGTRCISCLSKCQVLIVCSFPNVDAVAAYLKSLAPKKIIICAVGHIARNESVLEDRLCAEVLRKRIRGEFVDEATVRKQLKQRLADVKMDPYAPQGRNVELDRLFSLSIGIFDAVPIILEHDGKYVVHDAIRDAVDLDSFIVSAGFTTEHAGELGQMLRRLHELDTDSPMCPISPRDYYNTDPFIDAAEFGINNNEHAVNLLISDKKISVYFAPGTGQFFPNRTQRLTGPASLDVAALYSRLIIAGNGSIQRTNNLSRSFFKGYSHKPILSDVLRLTRSVLTEKLLSADNLTEYFNDNSGQIVSLLENMPINEGLGLEAFQKAVCDLSDNRGKLEGTILSQEQIIYQKRDGSEFSINLTNKCPNSCVFCIRDFDAGWIGAGDTNQGNNLYLLHEPTDDEIRSAVEAALHARGGYVELIKFCGYGEPLVRPQSILIITRHIKAFDPSIKVQVNTTGWPLYRDYCRGFSLIDFKEAGVDIFSVSINAPTKELYNLLTRPGVYDLDERAYEDTLRFIGDATTMGFHVKASLVQVPRLTNSDVTICERMIESLGANFIAREFVGKDSTESKVGIELETKIFGVDRDRLISLLKSKGARHDLSGLTTIINYDLPIDVEKRASILDFLQTNPPELRRFHTLLKEMTLFLKGGLSLYDRLGFLRIRQEPGHCRLIYKCPSKIGPRTKREIEHSYEIGSVEEGIAIMNLIGLRKTRRLQKNRETYYFYGVYFHVDTWPSIPTYLEAEGFDDIAIHSALLQLSIDPTGMAGMHAEDIFKQYGVDPTNLEFSQQELLALGIS